MTENTGTSAADEQTETTERPEAEDEPEPASDPTSMSEPEADSSEATVSDTQDEDSGLKGDGDDGIMTVADDTYSFLSILTASQISSANNYLNYTGGSGTHAIPIHQVKFSGSTYWAYCADSRKDWPGSSYSNYTQQSLPTSGLYQVQKVAMQLGFGDNNVSRLEQMFGYSLNNYEAYQATQAVLWAAQAWEEQWTYIASAPSSIRDGVVSYWKVATPSGKSANARNFALALADAVQSVYEDGISCSLSFTTYSETNTYVRYLLTVKTVNYYGGYTMTLSGLPSGTTVSTSDSDLSAASATSYTSSQVTGTDTLYVTVPKASASQTFTLTATATPVIRQYSSNSAVGFLQSGSSSYQSILYSGGTLTVVPKTGSVTRTVPALPKGSVTITKYDSQTGEPVPNVVFALYEYNGSEYVDTGKTAVTNAKGVASFTGLQYSASNTGLFKVFEKSSDTHEIYTNHYVALFSVATGKWYAYTSATASQTSGTQEKNTSGEYAFTFSFTAYNEPLVKTGSLTIQKRDGDGEALYSVSFVITDGDGNPVLFQKDSSGGYVPSASGSAQLTTDSKGQIKVTDLPYGTYLVTEVEGAEGNYTLLPTSFSVTLPLSSGEDELTYTVVNGSAFTLPTTGGSGAGDLVFLGLAVLALALLFLPCTQAKKPNSNDKRSLPQ
ncbi:MAG: hypothetical protein LUH45_02785 [Clostridiales bacterium]|nr:hypothetical protein [Clostridiales bacterium]